MGLYEKVQDYVVDSQKPGAIYRAMKQLATVRHAMANPQATDTYRDVSASVFGGLAVVMEIGSYFAASMGTFYAVEHDALAGLSVVGFAAFYRIGARCRINADIALAKRMNPRPIAL